uniref:Yippee like 4 n=1 Tax=Aquila chrysaetos chrysaetos TaxID=223781 RepID=A0A663ETA5_AQUCH
MAAARGRRGDVMTYGGAESGPAAAPRGSFTSHLHTAPGPRPASLRLVCISLERAHHRIRRQGPSRAAMAVPTCSTLCEYHQAPRGRWPRAQGGGTAGGSWAVGTRESPRAAVLAVRGCAMPVADPPRLCGHRVNVGCGPAEQRLLLTGLHSVADIFCQSCKTTLGWKYEQAFESSQKYKEGKFIIEMSHMVKENGWD